MSADADNQYFSDGLAEELINALTRLPGLHVASRTSSFRFRGREADIRDIGRELQVTAVLEGSVRRAGNRLRVTAQLTNVADGYHIWSERYDREMADVFAIQDEIVESIVGALAPALAGEAKRAVRRPTDNLDAYERYLKGRHFWHFRTATDLRSAIRCFEQVIALDADYALAYSGLADCLAICRAFGWFSDAESRQRAHEAVARALALDPSLAQVNFSRGAELFVFDAKWTEAESFFKRAVTIDPRMIDAHGYLGLVCACAGRGDDAQAHVDHARALDPLSPFSHYLAAVALCIARRYEGAEAAARRVLELHPDSIIGLWSLGVALCGLSQEDEAVTALERVVMFSRAPYYMGFLALAYGRGGRTDDTARLLTELEERADRGEYVTPVALLNASVGLADSSRITRVLERCIEDRIPVSTIHILCDKFLEPYRTDPEINRLVERLYRGPDGT